MSMSYLEGGFHVFCCHIYGTVLGCITTRGLDTFSLVQTNRTIWRFGSGKDAWSEALQTLHRVCALVQPRGAAGNVGLESRHNYNN
jgi:hypothetical protein